MNADEGGEEWFSFHHEPSRGPSGTILRLLYVRPTSRLLLDVVSADGSTDLELYQYPAVRKYAGYDPAIDIRAGAHSDYGQLSHIFTARLYIIVAAEYA